MGDLITADRDLKETDDFERKHVSPDLVPPSGASNMNPQKSLTNVYFRPFSRTSEVPFHVNRSQKKQQGDL